MAKQMSNVGSKSVQSVPEFATVGEMRFPVISHVPKVRLREPELAQVFGLTVREDGAIGWETDDGGWVFATIENVAQWSHEKESANRTNRPVSPPHALTLAKAMSNGEYYRDAYLNLIFSNGLVCNCQHTMVAAIHILNTRHEDFPTSEKEDYRGLSCPDDIAENGIDVILVSELDEILVDILDTARPRTPKDALIRRKLLSSGKPADNAAMASAVRLLVVRYYHQRPTSVAKIKVGTATTLKAMEDDSRFSCIVDVTQALSKANIKRDYDDESGTWKDDKKSSGYLTRKTATTGETVKHGFGLNLAYWIYCGAILSNGDKCTPQEFADFANNVAFSDSTEVPASLLELRSYLMKLGAKKTSTEQERWDACRAIIVSALDYFEPESDENFRLAQRLEETAFLDVAGQKVRNLYLQGGLDALEESEVPDSEVDPE